MLKKISLFAASLGIFAAVGFFLADGETQLQAHEDHRACPPRAIALDEGYGVSRIEMRPVCESGQRR